MLRATAIGCGFLLGAALAADSRGRVEELLESLKEADAAVAKTPTAAAYYRRGAVHFMLGRFDDSIRDFDKQIALDPKAKISHWQRGITYYYAGRFQDGIEQFEGYQTFDDADVENAVWRFMCMARRDGLKAAQAKMLKIGDDRRVPMRQIYDLYVGKLTPEQVLKTASKGEGKALNSQLFYAHLYLGIWHDLNGDRTRALDHLERATEQHRIGHYMWDVARVHRDLLKKNPGK